MANIATEGVLMKEEPTVVFNDFKFFVLITKSLFIDLCDFFNKEDLSLPDVVVHVSMNLWADEK